MCTGKRNNTINKYQTLLHLENRDYTFFSNGHAIFTMNKTAINFPKVAIMQS